MSVYSQPQLRRYGQLRVADVSARAGASARCGRKSVHIGGTSLYG